MLGTVRMRNKISKKIFSYWNNLRGEREAPDRREIEPSDIRDILGDTFILEIDRKYKTISFRLAGTRLCSAYGRELKGVGFLGLWEECDNLKVLKGVREVYENNQPCTISLVSQSNSGKFLEFELLMLPLLHNGTDSWRILGTATPTETAPYWLGHDSIVSNRLKSIRYIDLDKSASPSLVPKLDRNKMRANQGSRKVQHLTVFEGGLTE